MIKDNSILDLSEFDADVMNENYNSKFNKNNRNKAQPFNIYYDPFLNYISNTPEEIQDAKAYAIRNKNANTQSDNKVIRKKMMNKVLPESSRVKSQYKVMKGAINEKNSASKFYRFSTNIRENVVIPSPKQSKAKYDSLNLHEHIITSNKKVYHKRLSKLLINYSSDSK